jgi:serine-type D-Ala-D-Ala carboxypeptidase (penicillin-binding protein 5/6)
MRDLQIWWLRRRQRHWYRPIRFLPVILGLLLTLTACSGSVGFTTPSLGTGSTTTGISTTRPLPAPLSPLHNYNGSLPAAPTFAAKEAFLFNPATAAVYLANNADQEVPMASTTKIMTAYVAITMGQLGQPIRVGPDANGMTLQKEYGASIAGLQTGDVLSLHDLLYALLLPSGDDAAVAIADGLAGSQPNFVALMNLEAGLLGLRHTHYSDVHGLDNPGLYTTARDLGRLAAVAMQNPTFAQIVSTPLYVVPATADHVAYSWSTTNELLTSINYPGAIGIKTGYTGKAGGCLVFEARRPYGELLGVVLGESVENVRFSDAVTLLNWGFGIEEQQGAATSSGPSTTVTPTPGT